MDSPQRTKCSRSGESWVSVCTVGISLTISMDLLGVSELHLSAEELNQQIKQHRTNISNIYTHLIFCMRTALHREREKLGPEKEDPALPSSIYTFIVPLMALPPSCSSTSTPLLPSLHSSVTLNHFFLD